MAGTLETGAGTASLLLKWEKPQPEQEVGLPAQLPTWRAQVVLQLQPSQPGTPECLLVGILLAGQLRVMKRLVS